MSKLDRLASDCSNTNFKKIYARIRTSAKDTMKFTADGVPMSPVSHSSDEVLEIKNILADEVEASHIRDSAMFTTLSEVEKSVAVNTKAVVEGIAKDGFYNPMSGIGTSNDPGIYSTSSMPLLMGPGEVTSLYANGGLASIIIDKKAKGAILNGYSVISNRFTAQELVDLREHCESKGLSHGIAQGMVNGYNYGGAAAYPMFVKDTPVTTAMTMRQLIKSGIAAKGTLSHMVSADRWNLVVIPNYDLSAEDYMRPRNFYVPISGIQVNTERAAVLKPKAQPYWAAIRQLGWGMPDSTSYMTSLIAYKIVMASIPIMAQQMSLVVHRLPLEGIIAMNGPEAARKWQRENEAELRDWSMLNPKAINAYGEIDVLNRSYTGFGELVDALRKGVSSDSGLPESVIFYTQPSGIFNKTEEDVLLKQSETIKMGQSAVTPELNKLLVYYAIDLWGLPEGEKSLQKYQTLQFSFDTPVVSSPSEKADIGLKFAQMMAQLCGTGMPWNVALAYAKQYLGEVEVPKDIEAKLTSIPMIQPPEQTDPNVSGADDPNTPTAAGEPNAQVP